MRGQLEVMALAMTLALTPVGLVAEEGASAFAGPRLEEVIDAAGALVPTGVLYDQSDSPAGAGWTSQVFEPASAMFDCRAADDFTVPAADIRWDIDQVTIAGAYLGAGPTPLLDLEIFADSGGLPAATPTCSYIGLVSGIDFTDDGSGSFVIDLPSTCTATAGDYWLSVRADMDLAVGGQWLWAERSVQSSSPFVWENPPDGFGTGCVSWTPAGGCGATAPDLLFALAGEIVPVELQSITVE